MRCLKLDDLYPWMHLIETVDDTDGVLPRKRAALCFDYNILNGFIKFVRHERSYSAQLQNTLAAVQNSKLVHRCKVFATMSSDEFNKSQNQRAT